MKKFLMTCMLAFGSIGAFAQLGTLTVTASGTYNKGEPITASASFTPGSPTPVIYAHTWEIIPCDVYHQPIGAAIFSETITGGPSSTYDFPNTINLDGDAYYLLALTLSDGYGVTLYGDYPTYIEEVNILAPPYICCGGSGSVSGLFVGSAVQSWSWDIKKCNSAGTPLSGSLDGNSNTTGSIPSFPITNTVISSIGCGSYGLVTLAVTSNVSSYTIIRIIPVSSTILPEFFGVENVPAYGPEIRLCSPGATGGTLCLNANTGDVINWVGGPNILSWTGGNCMTVGSGATAPMIDTYTFNVTNSCGTTGDVSMPVATYDNTPNYYFVSQTSISPTRYKLVVSPFNTNTTPVGASHTWEAGEVILVNSNYVYVPGTVMRWTQNYTSNPGPQPVSFCSYNTGLNAFPYSTPYSNYPFYSASLCSVAGEFLKANLYRIVHIVNCPGCSATTKKNVIDQYGIACPNCAKYDKPAGDFTESFIISGDGVIREENRGNTGIHTTASTLVSFEVYPNPGTDIFHIHASGAQDGTIEVFDLLGHKMKSTSLNKYVNEYTLDLSLFAKGIYHVQMNTGKQLYSKKIVLE